jgi:hypothetical protein
MRRFVEFEEDPEQIHKNSINCLPLPILNDDETIDYKLDEIELAFEENKIYGIAQLFITTQRIIIRVKENDTSLEFDPQYIVLHAITRDINSYPKPCVYCQLDKEFDDNDDEEEIDNNDNNEEDNEISSENNIEDNKRKFSSTKTSSTNNIPNPNIFVLLNPSEMYLAPKDENDLLTMFEAFSRGFINLILYYYKKISNLFILFFLF